MCQLKKRNLEDESEDEDMVEGVFFHVHVSSDNESEEESEPDSENNAVETDEPQAGPSTARDDDPDWKASSDSSDDEGDRLIQAFKESQKVPRKHPPDINFSHHVVDLSFHPSEEILAIGSVTGDIFLYKYDLEQCELTGTIEAHTKSCRALEYSHDGDYMVSCGKEKTIMVTDTSTCKLKQFYDNAHESPPYSLFIISDNTFATGDQDGTLKVWDVRKKNHVCAFKVGEEMITSIISNEDAKYLACTSGSSLTAYDLNSRKLFVQSEPYDQELCSMKIMKQGRKLVVGSAKGTTYIFNWGEFGYHSDIYPGPNHTINSILGITENVLVAGCGDGTIRAVNLFPHRQLGIVGQHQVTIENMDISNDGEYIASIGFDECVKFWDIFYFENLHVMTEKSKKTDGQHNLPSSRVRNPSDFFAELL